VKSAVLCYNEAKVSKQEVRALPMLGGLYCIGRLWIVLAAIDSMKF